MSSSTRVHSSTSETKNPWAMIIYDQPRYTSVENLLYQAARANNFETAKRNWNKFLAQIDLQHLSETQVKILVNNLDDRKQWAPIHYAVDSNNLYVFSQLTTEAPRFRCDINLNTGNGENVLHIAARADQIWQQKTEQKIKGISERLIQSTTYCIELLVQSEQPEIVYHMLNLGTDINDRDDHGHTPLHLAVKNNRYNYAKELISRGADLMATTKLKASVLYFALLPNEASGDDLYKMVELILDRANRIERKTEVLNSVTVDNQTSLARALSHPKVTKKVVERLIEEGSEMNERQILVAFDMLARHYMPSNHSFEYLDPCIEKFQIQNDRTLLYQLLHMIVRYDNVLLLQWFFKNIEQVKSLATDKQSKDETNYSHGGYTVWLTAVFYNSQKCVQYLLEQEKSTNQHRFLLDINNNHENVLHILYGYKTELIRMTDVEGKLPIEIAARSNVKHICEKLLEHVKDMSTADYSLSIKGKVARHASEAGHLEILQLVLDFDPKEESKQCSDDMASILRETDDNDYTCLHLAAEQGHAKIVYFLLNVVKVEVDPIGARRVTPLHLACEKGHVDVVQLLLAAGASITFRNAQVYNCLEIAITNQQKPIVEELFQQPAIKEMMRNAQPIEGTEAFDTPMRKLIRYMPDIAVWLIDNKLTTVVGGPGQKIHKTIYDYEFYEDMYTVRDWYAQGTTLQSEAKTCAYLWRNRGVEAIHTCWCCCHSDGVGCFGCCRRKPNERECYTDDAYTLVRNHPLFVASQQKQCPDLVQHDFHTHLRLTKLRSFGLIFFIASLFFYTAYLALYTAVILMGKHPKYFYDKVNTTMTVDLSTCESVRNLVLSDSHVRNEALKTETYKRMKWTLYIFLTVFIGKNVIVISALFPKILRIGGSYIEISALILSYVYILDWYHWQDDILFRCPLQYQLGAMGLLLAYINFLLYVRTSPIYDVGIYVVMLQVISAKFLRFLPVLLIIICGFGFTYWMLLQYQTVYGTPIEALLRTSLMLFDLNYEDRLYDDRNGGVGYYTLVYVIFMLTAIACSIFVMNLLIGLAVGEIPTLLTQGTLWRIDILYTLLSDYEILRLRLVRAFDSVTCHRFRHTQYPWFRPRPYSILEKNELDSPMGPIGKAWEYTMKHFFREQIQDNIKPSIKSSEKK